MTANNTQQLLTDGMDVTNQLAIMEKLQAAALVDGVEAEASSAHRLIRSFLSWDCSLHR